MYTTVTSLGLQGLNCYRVSVEADSVDGQSSLTEIVGLPGATVRESRNRIDGAIRNSALSSPTGHITINLAPADTAKDSPLYDLPIMLGILGTGGHLHSPPADHAFLGELSMGGELRAVKGVLPMARACKALGITRLYVPEGNRIEAALAGDVEVVGASTVQELLEILNNHRPANPITAADLNDAAVQAPRHNVHDFSEVRGQEQAKRAMEIAAAGGHNLLMVGPPGTGKSMLARCLPSILPPMTREEALSASELHSVAGLLPGGLLLSERPFRSPHHTISNVGLAGGGTRVKPGELSLAHRGVLFLDELPEFSRAALEVLRQPLEDGNITISRASGTVTYPCRCMMVVALNPCPCGQLGSENGRCSCSQADIARYMRRISGPLLDRIDLQVEVGALTYDEMSAPPAEPSSAIRERVVAARARQVQRFEGTEIVSNSGMGHRQVTEYCRLSPEADRFMREAFSSMNLSARSHDRLCKVARTIADLAGSEEIAPEHLAEAVQYRALDRKYWRK
ncbi:MAG: YifB family Mg chelatase-like AAA ATPase [Clostridia bacterium]|nr:YifB family Mg chelatase-like AAA ATPase [Clostridia bacterium]